MSGQAGANYDGICKAIRHAIDVGSQLMHLGFAPFVPHYSHFGNLFHFHTWEQWMAIDKAWISVSDALLRLEGPSRGADQEVIWAQQMGKPVFTSIDALKTHYGVGVHDAVANS